MSTPETVYVNQLFPLKHGLPVWNPDPDVEGEVRIGDVGYMHRGTFCRVFNAMSDPTDPDNAECRLPQDFVKLDIPDKLKFYNPRAIHAGAVCSKSVQALKLSGELKAGDVLQGDFSITCMAEQGAALLLDDDAERKEIKPNRRMPKYMADHIQRWLDLINEIGLDIAAEDIYFVRGFVKSRTWATMTFQNASHETSGSVKFDYGPVGISLLGSWNNESSIPPLTRSGPLRPQANSSAFAITDGSSNTEISAPNGWPRDQCIFLNYYKVKMRRFFGPKVIKAAAGPSNLPSEETKRESRQAMSIMRDDESMVGDIVEEGDSSKFHDPVDYILDYILECAPEADLAVASDADISILCEDSAFSNDVAQLLRDRTPYIKLEANIGMLAPPITSQLPSRSTETSTVPENKPIGDVGGNLPWRLLLNNKSQMLKMRVEWVEKTSGPQHAPLWTSSAYIQGSLYGSGHGNTRVAAREAAARQACMNLSESHQ